MSLKLYCIKSDSIIFPKWKFQNQREKIANQMNKFITSRLIPAFANLTHSLSKKFQLF